VGSRDLFDTIKKEAPETAIIIATSIPYEKVRATFVGEGAWTISSSPSTSSPSITRAAS
jgi:hypothetical protein